MHIHTTDYYFIISFTYVSVKSKATTLVQPYWQKRSEKRKRGERTGKMSSGTEEGSCHWYSAISKHVRNRGQTRRRWLAERQSINSHISYCTPRGCVRCVYLCDCMHCIKFQTSLLYTVHNTSARLMRQTFTLQVNTFRVNVLHCMFRDALRFAASVELN